METLTSTRKLPMRYDSDGRCFARLDNGLRCPNKTRKKADGQFEKWCPIHYPCIQKQRDMKESCVNSTVKCNKFKTRLTISAQRMRVRDCLKNRIDLWKGNCYHIDVKDQRHLDIIYSLQEILQGCDSILSSFADSPRIVSEPKISSKQSDLLQILKDINLSSGSEQEKEEQVSETISVISPVKKSVDEKSLMVSKEEMEKKIMEDFAKLAIEEAKSVKKPIPKSSSAPTKKKSIAEIKRVTSEYNDLQQGLFKALRNNIKAFRHDFDNLNLGDTKYIQEMYILSDELLDMMNDLESGYKSLNFQEFSEARNKFLEKRDQFKNLFQTRFLGDLKTKIVPNANKKTRVHILCRYRILYLQKLIDLIEERNESENGVNEKIWNKIISLLQLIYDSFIYLRETLEKTSIENTKEIDKILKQGFDLDDQVGDYVQTLISKYPSGDKTNLIEDLHKKAYHYAMENAKINKNLSSVEYLQILNESKKQS